MLAGSRPRSVPNVGQHKKPALRRRCSLPTGHRPAERQGRHHHRRLRPSSGPAICACSTSLATTAEKKFLLARRMRLRRDRPPAAAGPVRSVSRATGASRRVRPRTKKGSAPPSGSRRAWPAAGPTRRGGQSGQQVDQAGQAGCRIWRITYGTATPQTRFTYDRSRATTRRDQYPVNTTKSGIWNGEMKR
jgi:hypothetical protein